MIQIIVPDFLITFGFRTAIVFKIHKMFQFNKIINRECVIANCALVAMELEDGEADDKCASAPPII